MIAQQLKCCHKELYFSVIIWLQYKAGSRFATVRFTTIHIYDPCPDGPSTPNLWCFTVATQASFLYLVSF